MTVTIKLNVVIFILFHDSPACTKDQLVVGPRLWRQEQMHNLICCLHWLEDRHDPEWVCLGQRQERQGIVNVPFPHLDKIHVIVKRAVAKPTLARFKDTLFDDLRLFLVKDVAEVTIKLFAEHHGCRAVVGMWKQDRGVSGFCTVGRNTLQSSLSLSQLYTCTEYIEKVGRDLIGVDISKQSFVTLIWAQNSAHSHILICECSLDLEIVGHATWFLCPPGSQKGLDDWDRQCVKQTQWVWLKLVFQKCNLLAAYLKLDENVWSTCLHFVPKLFV